MPNWCQNSLILTGPKKIIQEIEDFELSLEVILPCPTELRESPSPNTNKKLAKSLEKKYGSADWWNWCTKNWGTKWDIQPDITVTPPVGKSKVWELYATFESAWGPPDKGLELLYEKYKDKGLTLFCEYHEAGQKLAGLCKGRDGLWSDDHIEYESGDDLLAWADTIGSEMARSEAEYVLEREADERALADAEIKKVSGTMKATKKPATKKPATKKSATKKSATKKSATKKSATKKKLTSKAIKKTAVKAKKKN